MGNYFLIDEIDVMVWSLKTENTLSYVNKSLANFFGKEKEYYNNKDNEYRFSRQEKELIFDNYNKLVFKQKRQISTEKWISNYQGEERLLSISKVPKLSADGSVIDVICTANDITEQERLKRALDITIDNLNASEEFLLMNFQESNSGIILLDKNGKLIMFNDQICEMLGYSKDELIAINLFDITHPEDMNKIKYMLNILQSKKIKNFNIEKRLRKLNGDYIWVKFHSTLTNNEVNSNYILTYIEDISAKRTAEEMIREQREEIRLNREELEFNKLKNKFFTNVSHEFKTPLNLIFSSLHMMEAYNKKNNNDDERINTYLNIIKQNGNRLLRLVYNLIDLTKMDIDDYTLNMKKCDIVMLLRDIAESVELYMEDNERDFKFKSEIKLKEVTCDPLNIERIMLNLLSNAIKFTNKKDSITLTVREALDKVIISVKDTGIGIKKEKQELIFEQFRQVDESFSRETEGSGIGLSITKCLVDMHGGNIRVESEYGKGSEFIIELPINVDDLYDSSDTDLVEEFTNKVDIEFSDIYNG